MREALRILCAVGCGAEGSHIFETFHEDGRVTLRVSVCLACGERLQAEQNERHEALCALLRQGVDPAMADHIISARVERGEFMAETVALLNRMERE